MKSFNIERISGIEAIRRELLSGFASIYKKVFDEGRCLFYIPGTPFADSQDKSNPIVFLSQDEYEKKKGLSSGERRSLIINELEHPPCYEFHNVEKVQQYFHHVALQKEAWFIYATDDSQVIGLASAYRSRLGKAIETEGWSNPYLQFSEFNPFSGESLPKDRILEAINQMIKDRADFFSPLSSLKKVCLTDSMLVPNILLILKEYRGSSLFLELAQEFMDLVKEYKGELPWILEVKKDSVTHRLYQRIGMPFSDVITSAYKSNCFTALLTLSHACAFEKVANYLKHRSSGIQQQQMN